jgi:predicted PP-loop superfamily ATPase
MKKKNSDSKEVASQQKHEMKYICSAWKTVDKQHLAMADLKRIMKELGSNGKMCRSRRKIYAELRSIGYHYCRPKKK